MKLLSEYLKEESKTAHKAVESASLLKLLMSDQLTETNYIKILSIWLVYLSPIEKALDDYPEMTNSHEFLKDTPMSVRLSLDLAAFGRNEIKAVNSDKSFNSMAEVYATFYVVLGSMLGAQFITKNLTQHDFITSNKLHFYNGYGKETMAVWKQFKSGLDNFGEKNPDQFESVKQKVLQTFQEIQTRFSVN